MFEDKKYELNRTEIKGKLKEIIVAFSVETL